MPAPVWTKLWNSEMRRSTLTVIVQHFRCPFCELMYWLCECAVSQQTTELSVKAFKGSNVLDCHYMDKARSWRQELADGRVGITCWNCPLIPTDPGDASVSFGSSSQKLGKVNPGVWLDLSFLSWILVYKNTGQQKCEWWHKTVSDFLFLLLAVFGRIPVPFCYKRGVGKPL